MKRVLLVGAYGQDNLGDEALLETHVQQLRDYDLTVATSNPAQTAAKYGVKTTPTYGAATLRAILTTDTIVFGGGSLLKELPPPHARQRLLMGIASANAMRPGKVALSAVGAERILTPSGRALARFCANRSGFTSVRDEASAVLLRELGARRDARVVADPAFLLQPSIEKTMIHDERPLIVLNPMRSGEVECSRERVVASFAAVAKHAQRALGARVVVMPFKTAGMDSDAEISREIGVEVLPELRPSEALATLARASLFVGMRHHGALLAIHAGAPALAVTYAPKTENLVNELGLREHSLCASKLTPQRLVEAFDHAWANRKDIVTTAEKPLRAMRERAQENFDCLRPFIEGDEA